MALYKEIDLIVRSNKLVFLLKVLINTLQNPIFGNILMALYKEI